MTLDVRGGLKNTAINHSDYVVFEEMLSNAIDSYLIRRNRSAAVPPFEVLLKIELVPTDLLGNRFDIEISCIDNGQGFGDEEVKAFVTKDSTYKDQLKIPGIGKCKGAGRIQYFHHFDRFSIDSIFERDGSRWKRSLSVDSSTREISESSFRVDRAEDEEQRTIVRLMNRRPRPQSGAKIEHDDLKSIFSCEAVANHLYTSFLQRLIVLRGIIGNFSILVSSAEGKTRNEAEILARDLPTATEFKELPLLCAHGEPRLGPKLQITRYSFDKEKFASFQHEVALCANSAIVQPITKHYIKSPADRKQATDGKFELILVESELLESKVNQQRDGFDIPVDCGTSDTLDEQYSLEDVVDSLEDYVYAIITPKDFDRDRLVRATEENFGITPSMLEIANIKIHYGDTEENIAKRVLKKLQEDIVSETSKLIEVKRQILSLDPRTDDFRAKVNELAWKYTTTITKIDMTNLSQLVVRRSAMIEVLRHAVAKLLDCQIEVDGKRNEHERIIHNIFFPTGKDSTDAMEHDIWLLNEEYQYFEHIASDKPLSSLTWTDGNPMFEADIDDELLKTFRQNNIDHKAKRPDIALFSKEGAAIIIEFKAPGVEIQDHVNDLAQYARLLAAKSNGKIRKFYGYLIGTVLDETRVPLEWTPFPNDRGYFYTGPLVDRKSRIQYGELYSEMLFYQDFIDRAESRLDVYKRRLNLTL